jgi:DNA-directed RNA polymerase specialized sigma24 family protein
MARPSLSREELDALLAFLDRDRDRAGEKYQEIRQRLVKLFECRGLASPHEPADETMDRVATRLAAGEEIRTGEPAAYFYGVARNVLREHWVRQREEGGRLKAMSLVRPAARPGDDDTAEVEGRSACLDRCLESLPPETRRLVAAYYQGRGAPKIAARKELAAGLGISANALWVRAHRLRTRLERCVHECLDRARGGARPAPAPRAHEGGRQP